MLIVWTQQKKTAKKTQPLLNLCELHLIGFGWYDYK